MASYHSDLNSCRLVGRRAGQRVWRRLSDRDPLTESEGLDLVGILSAVDETAYVWDLKTDRIEWEKNAGEILGIADCASIGTGDAFHRLIAVEHLSRRLGAISPAGAAGSVRGTPYRIQYRFKPRGQRDAAAIQIEDQGRWWPGPDGAPGCARGVLRLVNNDYLEEQRQIYRTDLDELTGQLNRLRLTEALSVAIARAERDRLTAGFMIVAVNNLAVINETFGFDVGDEAIAAVGRKIKSKLRAGDVIGRYSSNKFGVILQDCGAGAMRIAAERFMRAVREAPVRTSPCQLSVTASIGGVIVPTQASSVNLALNNALRALDRTRTKRFDCFMAYEACASIETARTLNRAIADNVVNALDHKRMRLALQPMVSARQESRKSTSACCAWRKATAALHPRANSSLSPSNSALLASSTGVRWNCRSISSSGIPRSAFRSTFRA